jgi:hypothetical protein
MAGEVAMGWMASWIGVQCARKGEILEHFGLVETEDDVFPGEGTAQFSCLEFPGDWLVVFSEDFDWAGSERLLELSRFGFAIACQFEDKVDMTSSLTAARGGAELWRVFHDNTGSIYRLDVTGEAPAALANISETAFEQQRLDGGEDSSTDFVHEVALELGKAICGYRADEVETPFAALRELSADTREGRKPLSLLAKLLAPLRPNPILGRS